MRRTIIVTIAGAILSLLLASLATYPVLNHTQFGHLVTGNAQGISDPWKTFMTGFWILFFCVSLPATTLAATFVGLLAKKHTSIAAGTAVLPIAVISSGLEIREAWVTVLLVITAMLVATAIGALTKTAPRPQNSAVNS